MGFLGRKRLDGIVMSPGEKDLQMAVAGMQWHDSFSQGRAFWIAREGVPMQIRSQAIGAYIANPMDGATPLALAKGLSMLQRGELLSPRATLYLTELMAQAKTGPDRLRGGLSEGWSLAHKTGTGQVLKLLATAYNDVGILTSPRGKHYALVVMIAATNRPVKERQALMQNVTRSVIACEVAGWERC
jgi:beta-lactamase class A